MGRSAPKTLNGLQSALLKLCGAYGVVSVSEQRYQHTESGHRFISETWYGSVKIEDELGNKLCEASAHASTPAELIRLIKRGLREDLERRAKARRLEQRHPRVNGRKPTALLEDLR